MLRQASERPRTPRRALLATRTAALLDVLAVPPCLGLAYGLICYLSYCTASVLSVARVRGVLATLA